MSCPSILNCSLFVDGALPPAQNAELARHLESCAGCRERVALLREEARYLRQALRSTEAPAAIPAFVAAPAPGPGPARALLWLGWVSLALWAMSVAWTGLAQLQVPAWLAWLAPSALGAGIEMVIATLLDLVNGGGAPDGGLLPTGSVLLMTLVTGLLLLLGGRRGRSSNINLGLLLGVAGLLLSGTPDAQAFDVRRDEVRVTVAADETIDDTLVVMSESVLIEGTITGDLVVMGERVTVRGSVGGMVVAMAETLSIDGRVGGTLLAMGETVEMRDAELAGNAYAMGRNVTVNDRSRIAGNAALAAETAEMHGSVGRDLLGFAESLAVLGRVDGNVRSASEKLDVAASARIGGDLSARLGDEENARISPAASVGGESTVSLLPREKSRYLSGGYYAGQLVRFVAAFITGLVLLRFCPGLREVPLGSGAELLTAAGMGALALIAVPALALAAVLTIIGAPLGIVAFLTWLVALYLAGIVVAAIVGERLLPDEWSRPTLTLLVGLLAVFVVTSLPLVGGLMRLLVLLFGLGVLAQYLRSRWQRRVPV